MRSWLFSAVAPFGLAGLLFSPVAQQPVCSCPGMTVEEQIASADTIALGTVTEMTDQGAVMEVERYLKGGGPEAIAVHDLSREIGCGTLFPEDEGHRMIVQFNSGVSEDGYAYTVFHCLPSYPLASGDVTEGQISQFERSTGQGAAPESDDLPRAAMWAGAIALPVVFLAAAVLWANRGR